MNLNQVTVPADDLASSVAFYRALGLRLLVSNDHYARFEMPDGDATLSVSLEKEHAQAARGHGAHIYFECRDVDAEVERLRAAGIAVDGPVDQRWLWREAWLCDPAGNPICLYHAGANRKHPPWRIA